VNNDRPDKDVGRPVMHLAHEQAAAHGEAQVQRRGERLRNRLAAKRRIRALVDDVFARRHEVQRKKDPRSQEHDERVEAISPIRNDQ